MASLPPVVSEDQLLCPICLGVFVRPVSTPCGHNFCMSCLSSYWDSTSVCVCPVCKESYSQRPQLRVNTFISGLCESFINRPLSAEESRSRDMRAELGGTEVQISSMIEERVQKVQSIRQAVAQRQEETRHLTRTVADLTALVKKMEEKQMHVGFEAENVVEGIEKEIRDLTETQSMLKDVKLNQDAQVFMQNYPHNTAQSQLAISLESELEIQQLRNCFSASLSQLQLYFQKTGANFLSDISALKYVQQFAKDVALDPKTAHYRLVLSRDLKQVKFNPDANAKPNAASNSARFKKHLAVLGGKGIQSGKLYFEVLTGSKTEWMVGVALASLQRTGKIPHSPGCGIYAICFRLSYFETFCRPNVPIHQSKIEKVGVFVDYEGGQVSFYDVNGAKLIHTFEDCGFVEKVYPYFNPCNNEFENNLGPLVIVPVNQK